MDLSFQRRELFEIDRMDACQEFLYLKHKAMQHVAMMRNQELRLRESQDVYNNHSSGSTAEEDDEEVDVGMPPTPDRECSSSTPGPQSELVIDTSYENDESHRQSDSDDPWSRRKETVEEDLDDEVFVQDLPQILEYNANRRVISRVEMIEGKVLGHRMSFNNMPTGGELIFKVSPTRFVRLPVHDWWTQIERVQEIHESSVLLRMQEDNRTVELYARRMIPSGEMLRLWQGGGFEMPMENLFMNHPASRFHGPAPGLLYKPPITRCPAPNCRLCEINRDIRGPPLRLPLPHSSPVVADGATGLDFSVRSSLALDADNEEEDEEENGRGDPDEAGSDVEVSSNISSRNCSSTDRSSPGGFPVDHSLNRDLTEVGRLNGSSSNLVKCAHCDKQCRNKSSLLRHMKQHLEPHKQYTCEKCNKNFKTTSSLKQHMHIHSSVKPFKCDVCHKSYTQFSNLCRHKRMQAGCRSKIKCAHCGAEYTTSHSLERHIASCSQQGPHVPTTSSSAVPMGNPMNSLAIPGPHPSIPTSLNVDLPRISPTSDAIAPRMPRVGPWLDTASAPSAQVDPYYLSQSVNLMAMCHFLRARGAEEPPPATSPPPPAHRRDNVAEQTAEGDEDQPLDLSHRPTDSTSSAPRTPHGAGEEAPNIFSLLRLPTHLFAASGASLPPPMPVPYPSIMPGNPLSMNPAAAMAAAMAAMVPPNSSAPASFSAPPGRPTTVPRRPRSRPSIRPASPSPANGLRHSPVPAAEPTTPVPPSPSPADGHSPAIGSVRVSGSGSASRFPCTVCNKSFPRQANLNRHMRTHTGEQPYCCPVCRRPFSISSNMQRHVRNIHNQMRPHTCPTCSKRFAQRTNLERHLRLHERYGAEIPEGASPVDSRGASSGDESDVTGETGDVGEEMDVEHNLEEEMNEQIEEERE